MGDRLGNGGLGTRAVSSSARASAMERYARFIVRHRGVVLVAVIAITALLGAELRNLHLEIRRRAVLPEDHPYVLIQNRISDLFGGEAVVLIGVISTRGDIFTPQILAKVARITERVQRIPGVIESSVFSIAAPNVKAVTAGADEIMDIHPLMPEPPTSAADIQRIRHAVREDALFRTNLVSADETATIVVADFDDRIRDVELAQLIEQSLAPERDGSVIIATAGAPILRAELARYTSMMAILFPIAVLVIGLVHYEAFRTVQAMLLPLITALLSVVWSLGIMGWLRQPLDTWSAMTPVLILAIAAGHAVQILKRYYEEFARSGDNTEAVVRSTTAIGPVMVTAGCIAAAGFGSLATFGITSVRTFGLLLASGIVSALFIEMTFTPACRALLPAPKRLEMRRERSDRWLDYLLERLANAVLDHPLRTLIATAIIVVISLFGAARMEVDNSFRFWFSATSRIRRDDALLNDKLPGTATLRLLVDGAADEVLLRPDVLRAVADFESEMRSIPEVGGVTSLADHVKRMNQAMHGGDPAYFSIPDDQRLIGEYLFLYGMSAGPDGLSAFVDSAHRHAVIRALSKNDSATFSRALLTRLQAFADRRFAGLPVTIGIAGGTLGVQTAMNDVVVHEKIINLLQVSATIVLLCALVLWSFVGGFLVLIPLAVAMIVNFGIMGWAGIWLDMTTAAISAMGVSIGADFAIYLMFRIREEFAASGDVRTALAMASRTSGKALIYVSSAVALGYLVLPFSRFSLWVHLGVLTATIVSASALATLTTLPALAFLLRPRVLFHGHGGAPLAPMAEPRPKAAGALS